MLIVMNLKNIFSISVDYAEYLRYSRRVFLFRNIWTEEAVKKYFDELKFNSQTVMSQDRVHFIQETERSSNTTGLSGRFSLFFLDFTIAFSFSYLKAKLCISSECTVPLRYIIRIWAQNFANADQDRTFANIKPVDPE